MRRSHIILLLSLGLILVILGAYQHWRSAAPAWQGQTLRLERPYTAPLEVLIVGDTGTGDTAQFKVADAMERYCRENSVDAVLMLGDNFYQQGVTGVDDPQWQSKFHQPYGQLCLERLTFYPILGNHDYRAAPEAQIAYQGTRPSWLMPHRFYSLQWGQRLKVIATDTNRMDLCGDERRCGLDFLRHSLADSPARQTIVLGHHPLISSSVKYQDVRFQSRVLQHTMCGKADAYLAGHSHHLEHRVVPECELHLFISGGGGASLYDVGPPDTNTRFAESTHGFLSMRIEAETLEFTFFDTELRALYQTTIPAAPN